MTTWAMTNITIKRLYALTDAPDVQDTSSNRRRVIRPRTVELHQLHGSNQVRWACVEGPQVRRDGELAGNIQILFGPPREHAPHAPRPQWLEKILAEDDLEWVSGVDR